MSRLERDWTAWALLPSTSDREVMVQLVSTVRDIRRMVRWFYVLSVISLALVLALGLVWFIVVVLELSSDSNI